jgi:hypothetical protein
MHKVMSRLMTKRLAVCFIPLIPGFVTAISAQEKQALRLVQTIPLPGVTGRLDHMGVDLEKKRLFVAAVVNNTLEVVDLADAKVIKNLPGFKPDPNRLFYDPSTNPVYFGNGGQNAGFDAHERVGILQPKAGAGYDQLVADMIAPTRRPGHLGEIAMDENGLLLICDSRADQIYQFDTRKRELITSWPAHGDGAADMALDRTDHRLFVGTRTPAEMTVYDSLSGKEIQNLPGAGNDGRSVLRREPQAGLHDRRPLVRNARRFTRMDLRLRAEGPRSLRGHL